MEYGATELLCLGTETGAERTTEIDRKIFHIRAVHMIGGFTFKRKEIDPKVKSIVCRLFYHEIMMLCY